MTIKSFNNFINESIEKKVHLKMVGLDGNAYSILGAFQSAARKEGWTKEEIEHVIDEAQSKDYNHLLKTIASYCINPLHDEDDIEYEEIEEYDESVVIPFEKFNESKKDKSKENKEKEDKSKEDKKKNSEECKVKLDISKISGNSSIEKMYKAALLFEKNAKKMNIDNSEILKMLNKCFKKATASGSELDATEFFKEIEKYIKK